jgi:hypothetical protein
MFKSTVGKSLLIASIMLQSPFAMSRDIVLRSSIDGIPLDGAYQPPLDVQDSLCKSYTRMDNVLNSEDTRAMQACSMGVSAAAWMAQRYAAAEGNFLGCLDGLQQGLFDGYIMTENPSQETIASAQKLYSNLDMPSASSRAEVRGRKDVNSLAESLVVSRFKGAVGTGVLPDSTLAIPKHTFKGIDGGYEYDNQGLSDESASAWGVTYTDQIDRTRGSSLYRIHKTNHGGKLSSLCNPVDINFSQTATIWDLFRARGEYNFQKYGWKSSDRSWDRFENGMKDTEMRLKYMTIEGRTKVVSEPDMRNISVEVDDTTKPILDAAGMPTGKFAKKTEIQTVQVGFIQRTVDIKERDKRYYQSIYSNAFKTAYEEYYARTYFGLSYVKSINGGYNLGKVIGGSVGSDVAKVRAEMGAYNQRYKEISIARYNYGWEENYKTEFQSIWNLFANNSMVEVLDGWFYGNTQDGIFTPGETLGAKVKLRNLGFGKDIITLSASGTGLSALNTKVLTPDSSNTFNVDAQNIAQVTAGVGENVYAQINMTGGVNYESQLVTRKSHSFMVNEVAEVRGLNSSFDTVTGAGTLYVTIHNPSSLATSATVSVEAEIRGLNAIKVESLKLEAGETKSINIPFNGIDPLSIIKGASVSGLVRTKINGRVLDQKTFRNDFSRSERLNTLSKYFHAFVNDASLQASVADYNDRLQALIGMVLSTVSADKENDDFSFNNENQVKSSMLGMVAYTYEAAKTAGTLSANAIEKYNSLGKLLDSNIDPGRFQRKEFRIWIHKFAASVEVKKKNK